jgi:CubicO group peptidase (beta-lactamase class C family)
MASIIKKNRLVLSAGFVFFAASLALFPAIHACLDASYPTSLVPSTAQSSVATDPGYLTRASRIESGLLPAVVIKGARRKPMTIPERMAFYKVPGVSIVFFDHGQILRAQTYGFADLTSKKPVTPDTLFQSGSISKPVTALGALRLVQEGKLSLDEDVNSKLRTWRVPENAFTEKEKVTLRRILSHSAGVTVGSFQGYSSDEPIPTIGQILNGEKPANNEPIRVDVVPGSRWRYSGGGFVILQTLVSDVTGKPFPEIMSETVLGPAGMNHSTFEEPLPKVRAAEAATPYRANGAAVQGGPHVYPETAAAGLWTTPSDLARMAMELQKEYAGSSSGILDQSMAKQMLSRQKGTWGLGFEIENRGQSAHFDHGGGTAGYGCFLEAYSDSGPGLAVMTNSDTGGELVQEILRSAAKEYGWPDHHPIEILGFSLGGVVFVAAPCLVVMAYRTWTEGLRQDLSRWRSFVGLASIAGTFLSWLSLAVLASIVLMDFNISFFPPYWITRMACLTFVGALFAFVLRGSSRIGAILAGLLMATAWLTSVVR